MSKWRVYNENGDIVTTVSSNYVAVQSGALVFFNRFETSPVLVLATGQWEAVDHGDESAS